VAIRTPTTLVMPNLVPLAQETTMDPQDILVEEVVI